MSDLDALPARPKIEYRRQHRSWAVKYLLGSAFVASVWELLVFMGLTILWFVLFDYAIEEAYPSLFPVSDSFSSALFLIISLLPIFFLGLEHSLYNSLITEILSVFGNTTTLAQEICASVDANAYKDARVDRYWIHSLPQSIDIPTSISVRRVLRDLNILCSAMPLAQRFEHRTERLAKGQRSTLERMDMLDVGSSLNLDDLPLTRPLRAELRFYSINSSTSGLADQLWNLIYARLSLLYYAKLIPKTMFQAMDRQISGLTTSTAIIIANKAVGALPIVRFFLQAITYVWCFALPWSLWGAYRWFGLLAAFIQLWAVLALWRMGPKLADPFDSYNKSPFIWHDITQAAVNTAKEIDKVFQHLELRGLGRLDTEDVAYVDLVVT